jgi:hypothetical protein
MAAPPLRSSLPHGPPYPSPSHDASHPYSDAHVASTLSRVPFADFCKLRDDWAAKPLIRGHYRGLCGGDPAQRDRREDFENITLVADDSDAAHGSPTSSGQDRSARLRGGGGGDGRTRRTFTLPGQVEPYSRSAAGKVIDPRYQRTTLALEKTMHFLVEHYMRVPHTPLVYTDPFRIWGYLWDRFRGVRTTWGPQLPPSNVSVKGYVDSETRIPLAVDDLRRESHRRVRWLEFTAAALAVGAAYLCLSPQGCRRFMQDKKQFLESISQCFTDLTVFYRAEQRLHNAEFFSVLLLLYGLNQEMKVEDRATFCRFDVIQVDGTPQRCPEPPAESVNLAQVIRELEKQPYMVDAQPVRAALELLYSWSTRRWFAFFELCKSTPLTLLQRAVVFQSFTYARYRAVLDLVLPNYYVYPKLRVRDAMAVTELADQLMMDAAHCREFLIAMGLEAQLERKPQELSTASADAAAEAWYLNLCQSNSDPLVTADELEERCPNKRELFFPTYPEFFGFRVWREAYERFPNAAELAKPAEQPAWGSDGGAAAAAAAAEAAAGERAAGSSSPAGRGAVNLPPSPASCGRMHRLTSQSGDVRDDGGANDDFYTDEYTNEMGEGNNDDDNDNGGGSEGGYGSASGDSAATTSSPTSAAPSLKAGAGQCSEAYLLRQPGCPINLMEVLEVYCPPYHDEVEALELVDASPELFASLRQHRTEMLRRCRQVRRRAHRWRAALIGDERSTATLAFLTRQLGREGDGDDVDGHLHKEEFGDVLSESEEAWVAEMEQESISTRSSIFSGDEDDAAGESSDAEQQPPHRDTATVGEGDSNEEAAVSNEMSLEAGVASVLTEARRLVSSLNSSTLYAEAVADQQKLRQKQEEEERVAAECETQAAKDAASTAAAAAARPSAGRVPGSPTPHIPILALPETGGCSVVPLPDNYGDDDESDGRGGPRCNSQTSRVIVESPATLPSTTGASSFPPCDAPDGRETSAEAVEPHSPSSAAASKLFSSRPVQHDLIFGAAKTPVPPLKFNTAMPQVPTSTAAAGSCVSPTAAAASSPTAETTTPNARLHPSRDYHDDGVSEGRESPCSSSSTDSSPPTLEYSHLKRRAKGAKEEDGEGEEGVEEVKDVETHAIDSSRGADEKAEGEQGLHSRSSSAPVSLFPTTASPSSPAPDSPAATRTALDASSTPPAARPSLRPLIPPASTTAVADSFTPLVMTSTRRSRADGAGEGGRGWNTGDGFGSNVDSADTRRELVDSPRSRNDGKPRKRFKPDEVSQQPLALYEVDVFAEVCVPLISEYLQLWTQITHGDLHTLEVAAQCVLEAQAAERSSASTSVAFPPPGHHHYEAPLQRQRCQTIAHALARRASKLLTTAVLRGAMSEYGQCMWDLSIEAASAAAAPSTTPNARASVLGSLWATSCENSIAHAAGKPEVRTRHTARDNTSDAWASLFSRGCSAAMIPRYEVQAMLAVEGGAVPVLPSKFAGLPHLHSRGSKTSLQTSAWFQSGLRGKHSTVVSRGSLAALSESLTASLTANTVNAVERGRGLPLLQSSMACGGHGQAAGHRGSRGVGGSSTTHVDDLVREVTSLVAAADGASLHRQPAPPQPHVVFDESLQQFVVWNPTPTLTPPSSSSVTTFSHAQGTPKGRPARPVPCDTPDAAVLQLTSAFIMVSNRCSSHPADRPEYFSKSSMWNEGAAQLALNTLFANPKEQWLARLLLPSSDSEVRVGCVDAAAAAAAGPQADLRNDRVVWLSGPAETKKAQPLVARLYQKDQLTDVPVINSRCSSPVPLVTRITLFGCDIAALRRVRVRRDGGVRLLAEPAYPSPSDASASSAAGSALLPSMPPSTLTSLAMSHAHYTAIAVVDLASAQAIPAAQRTLMAIVDSHVPRTRVTGGCVESANCLAGVLVCVMDAADACAGANEDASSSSSSSTAAVMTELENFFWEQWIAKHGTTSDVSTTADCNPDNSSRGLKGRRRAKVDCVSSPAVVCVRVAYGDADRATAAVAQGVQTIMATYAQQAVAVLGAA